MGTQRISTAKSATLDRFRWDGFEPQRNHKECDRYAVRFPLNVSVLAQTIRFLPSKVVLFHLDAPTSQAGARAVWISGVILSNRMLYVEKMNMRSKATGVMEYEPHH